MTENKSEQVEVTLRDVYNKIEDLEAVVQEHTIDVVVALGKRPTRLEVLAMVGGGVASISLVFTAVRLI